MADKELRDFNRMVQRFNEMGLDEGASVGAGGIMQQHIRALEENTKAIEKEEAPARGSSSIKAPNYQKELETGGLVEQLRLTTFSVKVENAMGSIVDPMFRRNSLLLNEKKLFDLDLHNRRQTTARQTLMAVQRLNQTTQTGLAGLYNSYKEFMRFPVWNSLRAIGNGITKTVSTTLFGLKKRQSDTDRIVEAIKKQTEFMRTGAIDNTQNIFQRVLRGGILGTPLRAMGESLVDSFTGISQERAQQREDNRAQGMEDNSWAARMSTIMYLGRLNQRGTRSGASGGLDEGASTQNKIVDYLASIDRNTLNGDDKGNYQQQVAHSLSSLESINARSQSILQSSMQQSNSSLGSIVNMLNEGQYASSQANDVQQAQMSQMVAGSDITSRVAQQQQSSIVHHQKAQQEHYERMEAANEDSYDQQRAQTKWLSRIRDGQIWAQITRVAGLALNGIKTILGSILGGITAVGGTLTTMLALRRGRAGVGAAGDMMDGPGRNTRRSRGKVGVFKRIGEWFTRNGAVAKDAITRNAAKAAPVAARVAPWAIAASVGSAAGRFVAPGRAANGGSNAVYTPPPESGSGNNAMALPGDGFQDRARQMSQSQGNTSIIGDKLNETFNSIKDTFSEDSLRRAFNSSSSNIEAKVDSLTPALQGMAERVGDASREQWETLSGRSTEQRDILNKMSNFLEKLVKNDDRKMREQVRDTPSFLGGFSTSNIFGD